MHAGRDVNLYYEGGFAVARFDSRPWLRRLHHETLVVIPTDDQLVDPALQYDLASRLPHVEIVELVGARHESVLTHAPEFAQAIHQFVRQSGELEVVDGEAG